MIFDIGLITGVRLSELHQLTNSKFLFGEQEQEVQHVILIRSIVGYSMEASKNAKGGWCFDKEKPKEVTIFAVKTWIGL